ncbi:MAG: hypothetical protein H6672_01720 [Anaerolineaceae bacterium]|nr:hypothetical protein [Anaerolineaceae bacterium]
MLKRLLPYWPLAAIPLLALVFFARPLFSGMILARGDVFAYFTPYWHVRNMALMNGQIPLWTPDIFMGAPLLANSQIGILYPPNWLVAPLTAPDAIAVSLVAHVIWGMFGAYWLGRRALRLDALPAVLVAAVFGLGGYLGAQAEHINQLQALAWMPWVFGLLQETISPFTRRGMIYHAPTPTNVAHDLAKSPSVPLGKQIRYGLLLALALALQLLAGHPQTGFITLVGLGLYAVFAGMVGDEMIGAHRHAVQNASFDDGGRPHRVAPTETQNTGIQKYRWGAILRHIVLSLLILVSAGGVALALAAPQLIPTLELAGTSNRSGGLLPQQVMAFSLNPVVVGRGLLPSYDSLLFGEYVSYPGVIALGLMIVGIVCGGRRERWVWVGLALVGFVLALGLYTPLYWLLAGLPGFSFFRVPARWLALFALGAALLAGLGLQSLYERTRRPAWWVYVLIIILIAGLAGAAFLAERMPEDVIGSAVPTNTTLAGWGLALVALLAGLTWRQRGRVHLLAGLAVVELFAAAGVLAYNEVVPRDAFDGQRFTVSQLLAYDEGETPPGRVLSISQLLFDPGDLEALTARYATGGLSPLATRIALVDTKMRETLSANLPLIWGIPSIDGFDGGLLPTGAYSDFTSLLLPPGAEPTTDGRLREILAQPECRGACIPDSRWLNLTNTRYLITDKVYDLWHDDVAYDTQFLVSLEAGGETAIRTVPDFVATALDVLYSGDVPPGVTVTYDDGSSETLTRESSGIPVDVFQQARFILAAPRSPVGITITGDSPVTVAAVTLVDTRVGAFQQLTLGAWRRVLSSDIKLYENLDVFSRAFVVTDVVYAPDEATVLDVLRDPTFNPVWEVVLLRPDIGSLTGHAGREAVPRTATITRYTAETVEITVSAGSEPGSFLVLTDAFYPGWTATVNSEPVPVDRADGMFRAVLLPPQASTVVFTYAPGWWPGILVWGGVAWAVALLALAGLWWRGVNGRSA